MTFDWAQAVLEMKAGRQVRRVSQQKRELVGHSDGVPIYECGTEAMRLAAAWTQDGLPAFVFQGVGSKALFAPESEDMEASDWEIAD